jgi:hypothetical protein
MAQPKINPEHPVTKSSIASDRQSSIGCGAATKGEGNGISTTSGALNKGEGKSYGAGSMGSKSRPLQAQRTGK